MAVELKKLGDVCRLINGRAYKKHEMLSEGKYPLLRVGNFFTNRSWFYSDLELSEDKYCDKGDLLYAWSASFGPRIWDGDKVIYHYHIWKIELNNDLVDKGYLFHLLEWDTEQIKEEQGTGTTMIHVTKGAMENRLLPFPSIPEQKLIVSILDTVFANLEQTRAKTEQNLKNARELFDSYLQQVFSQKGEGWVDLPLGRVCTFKHGFAFKSEFFVDESDLILLTPGNFYEDGGYRDRGGKQKYYKGEFPKEFLLSEGSLLVAMTEQAAGLLGSSALVPNGHNFLHNQRLGLVEITSEFKNKVSLKFLFHLFNTKHFRQKVQETATGLKVRHTSPKKMEVISVPFLMNLNEQEAIAQKLFKAKERAIELETIYQKKLNAIDELKKSILQKAFSGELTKTVE
ncbi:type I restriction enzyme, S subunit [Marinomonas polaris DSM 16579]|uniref:Type I restriction enzyme, S subunit n=1 Tax=Marinomonas polaris DSM 16579 TaxID=1122206 RepID=A0A1M4X401_9GAMM|nr:restriction endonuclease subunit S [Marinomonas polaris]SHE88170.1 type I restriction enzyme, S subunit [Marinomonas polaris DSM 16579]